MTVNTCMTNSWPVLQQPFKSIPNLVFKPTQHLQIVFGWNLSIKWITANVLYTLVTHNNSKELYLAHCQLHSCNPRWAQFQLWCTCKVRNEQLSKCGIMTISYINKAITITRPTQGSLHLKYTFMISKLNNELSNNLKRNNINLQTNAHIVSKLCKVWYRGFNKQKYRHEQKFLADPQVCKGCFLGGT